MNNQEAYDELDNIISSIDLLVNEISNQYYIDMLNELKYQAQDELEEVERQLQEEQWQEEREMNHQFERSRF